MNFLRIFLGEKGIFRQKDTKSHLVVSTQRWIQPEVEGGAIWEGAPTAHEVGG